MTAHFCKWFLRGLHNQGGFMRKIMSGPIGSVVLALSFTSLGFPAQVLAAVHAAFELSAPATGPFPSDWFTVRDTSHNTRRRVNLPLPQCTTRAHCGKAARWDLALVGLRGSERHQHARRL
jgi:hypothetical protein